MISSPAVILRASATSTARQHTMMPSIFNVINKLNGFTQKVQKHELLCAKFYSDLIRCRCENYRPKTTLHYNHNVRENKKTTTTAEEAAAAGAMNGMVISNTVNI